jgi:hypothetical protein
MDIYTGTYTKRNSNYFLVMARLEADTLIHTAEKVSAYALKDFFNRSRFRNEIQVFVASQLDAMKTARNDNERKYFLNNLVQEKYSLEKQSSQLHNQAARIHASVVVTQDEKNVWSYVIDGVGVVLGGVQIFGGLATIGISFGSGNIVGVIAGGLLVMHGFNGFQEGLENIISGSNNSVGAVKNVYIQTANFMGFSGALGATAFGIMDLSLSGYGMGRMILKPDAWRLFRYVRSDFILNVKIMSKTALTLEAYNDGWTVKSIMDNQR